MSDAYAAPWQGRGRPREPWAMSSAQQTTDGAERPSQRHPHGGHDGHGQGGRRDSRRAARSERKEGLRAAYRTMAMQEDGMDPEVAQAIETLRRAKRGGGRRFGPGGPFGGPGRGRGRGGRARRGDVRAAILTLLAEEPRNGYGVIQEIDERSNGVWKPSPGAVYPALQQLEDEGLVAPVEIDGRKLFELTDAGRAYVTEHLADAPAPWAAVAEEAGTSYRDAKHQLAQVWHAYAAVAQDGNPEQVAAASKVLADARRSLYRILAEDHDGPVGDN